MAVISYQKTESEALEQIKKAIPDSMKENLVKKSKGLFAELFESKIFPNHYLACSIDGIGTKLLIAAALDKYDTVGIDLVAMCANDLATLGNVQPFLFMDYLAVQEKVELKAGDIIRGIVKGLEMCDTAGIFRNDVKINFGKGETASIGEMLDSFKEGYGFDLAAAMIGFVPKNFRQKEIVAGDKIIALRSSGLHSNGYTDARKFLLRGDFETRKSNKAFYRGKFSLNDKLDAIDGKEGKTIGEVLLEPTRIYVKPVAEVAKKLGILTIAIVTLPFAMEGQRRYANAISGLEKLEATVDTLIVIPNDKLLELCPGLPLHTAFKVADEILTNSVKGIAELVTKPGLVNLDFADIKTVMGKGGVAMIGVGESDSENRAIDSVEKAIQNPLLDVDITGANGALINISGGPNMTLDEARKIVETITQRLDEDARTIWGAQISEDLEATIRTLIIVTGVHSPQIFGAKKNTGAAKKKKSIQEDLGIDFVN